MNSKEFSLKIEAMVKEKQMPYMDAVIDYCKSNYIDVGQIQSMVNNSLKEKIKSEAINLKMLKEKKGGTLPV